MRKIIFKLVMTYFSIFHLLFLIFWSLQNSWHDSTFNGILVILLLIIYLSKTNCSSPTRSQAMYSRAASVTRGHQDKSKICNFGRFSAISSIPSSVILLQPDRLKTVRLGSEWTENKFKHNDILLVIFYIQILFYFFNIVVMNYLL